MTDKTTDAAFGQGKRYILPDASDLEQVLRESPTSTPDANVSAIRAACAAITLMMLGAIVVLGLEDWHETRIQMAELRTIEAVGAPADLEDYFHRHYGLRGTGK